MHNTLDILSHGVYEGIVAEVHQLEKTKHLFQVFITIKVVGTNKEVEYFFAAHNRPTILVLADMIDAHWIGKKVKFSVTNSPNQNLNKKLQFIKLLDYPERQPTEVHGPLAKQP